MAADSSLRAGSSNASSMTLADLLTAPGSGRPAVVLPESELAVSRAKLASEIARLSDVLALGGVEPQTPVSIVLVNGLEFIVSFLALCNARAVAAPLNPAYKADEFKFYMEDAEARAVILPPGPHPAGRRRHGAEPADLGGQPRPKRQRPLGARVARER